MDIDEKVELYRQQLIKEQEAIAKYIKTFGREPCCAKNVIDGHCVCWQDSW